MRVIGGKYKGRHIYAPQLKETRPTTDYAKEGLFNVLQHNYNLSDISVLDLFCGTGNISLEFISRGAHKLCAVDNSFKAIQSLKKTFTDWDISNAKAIKQDVFRFLFQCTEKFDLIFADPPFDYPYTAQLPDLIYEKKILNKGGVLIIEHPDALILKNCSNFIETRHYGKVNFSFFK